MDKLLTRLVVRQLEACDTADIHKPSSYGRMEEIARGDRQTITKNERYIGVIRVNVPQCTWGADIHIGGNDFNREGCEDFGTLNIAQKLGFSPRQARRIAESCFGVDTNITHYHDPLNRHKPRITCASPTGTKGDFHRHYNRSPKGMEDSRIVAAGTHLDRAVELANERFFDAAERELGIGLHSLQDMFSHAQLTPLIHSLLGEFPDLTKYQCLAVYETALATECYMRSYIERLHLTAPRRPSLLMDQFESLDGIVTGNSARQHKLHVAEMISRYPPELIAFLKQNALHVFVGAQDTRLTELGFGMDLDGDGEITPGKWVDVTGEGEKHWFLVEDQFGVGKEWNSRPAAYNHETRMIFISTQILNTPACEEALKHEMEHAIDFTYRDHPLLGDKWSQYVNMLYENARRNGHIAFNDLDPHEYFARLDRA